MNAICRQQHPLRTGGKLVASLAILCLLATIAVSGPRATTGHAGTTTGADPLPMTGAALSDLHARIAATAAAAEQPPTF